MAQRSVAWPELLEPVVKKIFFDQFDGLSETSLIPRLFDVEMSSLPSEEALGVGGIGNFPEYKNERIEFEDFAEGFNTTLTHREYAKGMAITRKLWDDDSRGVMKRQARQFGGAAARTREEHAGSVFNNSFSASFVGGDGVALCSASHPLSPSNASVQSNAGSTALSYDAVNDTWEAMEDFTDDKGKRIAAVNPNLLLIPRQLEGTANEIVKTMRGSDTQQPNTADFSASLVQQRSIDYVVWKELTDANNWWLIDEGRVKEFLLWFDRVAMEFTLDPGSDFNLMALYRAYMRYSFGWIDWKWVFGHSVA